MNRAILLDIPYSDIIIATTNIGHLAQFVGAVLTLPDTMLRIGYASAPPPP